jgi:hypothetical protein
MLENLCCGKLDWIELAVGCWQTYVMTVAMTTEFCVHPSRNKAAWSPVTESCFSRCARHKAALS